MYRRNNINVRRNKFCWPTVEKPVLWKINYLVGLARLFTLFTPKLVIFIPPPSDYNYRLLVQELTRGHTSWPVLSSRSSARRTRNSLSGTIYRTNSIVLVCALSGLSGRFRICRLCGNWYKATICQHSTETARRFLRVRLQSYFKTHTWPHGDILKIEERKNGDNFASNGAAVDGQRGAASIGF